MDKRIIGTASVTAALAFSLLGCSDQQASTQPANASDASSTDSQTSKSTKTATQALDLSSQRLTDVDISTQSSCADDTDGGHAIAIDGENAQYSNVSVAKNGRLQRRRSRFLWRKRRDFHHERGHARPFRRNRDHRRAPPSMCRIPSFEPRAIARAAL